MEPIKGILDENFFLVASDECLTAMSKLIDDMVAKHLQLYVADPSSDPAVVARIKNFLGEAMMQATFHNILKERGSCSIVRKIQLAALPTITGDVTEIINELEFLQANYHYVHPYIEPRRKEDYDAFLRHVPRAYKTKIEANKVFFYQAAAVRRSTGVKIIIDRHDEWVIALNGLKTIRYFLQQGLGSNNYITTRF